MARTKFAQEISKIKRSSIAGQKTLLSQVREIVDFDDIILDDSDFRGGKRSRLVVVFADSLSIMSDVASYLNKYYARYGEYPCVVCLPGSSSSKYVDFGMPIETWMKIALCASDIPESVVYRYDIDSSNGGPIEALKSFLKKARYKHASVFTARGYSVSTIVSLKREIPDIDFKFYDKAYISEDCMEKWGMKSSAIFDTDDLEDLGIDLILGELVRLNLIYNQLPNYLQRYLMPLETVKKYTDKGYILGLNTEEEMKAVGISVEQFDEMLPKRLADLEWIDNPKERIYGQIMSL